MTPKFSCDQTRELAAEMALGTISGDERAGVITHISSCSPCRVMVEELSQTADALLLLGPEHEPPAGFESKVLAQFNAGRGSRRGRWIGAAAAIILAALLGAGTVLWTTADEREIAAHYEADLAEANGEYFGVKPLRADNGTKVGNVFAYEGDPSWFFVVIQDAGAGTYRIELVQRDGTKSYLGEVTVAGVATWGSDIDAELKDVAALRFITSAGDVLDARFGAN